MMSEIAYSFQRYDKNESHEEKVRRQAMRCLQKNKKRNKKRGQSTSERIKTLNGGHDVQNAIKLSMDGREIVVFSQITSRDEYLAHPKGILVFRHKRYEGYLNDKRIITDIRRIRNFDPRFGMCKYGIVWFKGKTVFVNEQPYRFEEKIVCLKACGAYVGVQTKKAIYLILLEGNSDEINQIQKMYDLEHASEWSIDGEGHILLTNDNQMTTLDVAPAGRILSHFNRYSICGILSSFYYPVSRRAKYLADLNMSQNNTWDCEHGIVVAEEVYAALVIKKK